TQQDRKVDHRESMHERQRHPDEWIRPDDESPCGEREDRELPHGNQQVAYAVLLVEGLQLLPWQRPAELGPQCSSVLTVLVVFHGNVIIVQSLVSRGQHRRATTFHAALTRSGGFAPPRTPHASEIANGLLE